MWDTLSPKREGKNLETAALSQGERVFGVSDRVRGRCC
jgi:hypothetical protein